MLSLRSFSYEGVTHYINEESSFDRLNTQTMLEHIYNEVRKLAYSRLQKERASGTLNVTAIVHEVFIRMKQSKSSKWENRRHFFGVVSQTMRRILVEKARYQQHKGRAKGLAGIELDDTIYAEGVSVKQALELEMALDAMEKFDKELSKIVKLKFFVGLSYDDIADIFHCSPRTIERKWQAARAWLSTEVSA